MLGTLFKKELNSLGATLMNSGKSKGRYSFASVKMKALVGVALIYFLAVVGFLIFSIAQTICEPFVAMGLDWAYYAVMGMFALTFSLIGGSMTAYSTLYKAKDNEFLLSLPIRPSLILSTRVLICYLVDFVITAIIIVISVVVYALSFPLTTAMIVGGVVLILIFPLVGLCLSLLLGWLIALATSKVPPEKKSYVSLVFVILFLAAYLILYMNMMDIMDMIVSAMNSVAGFLETWIKPVFWMGKAAAGDWASMGLLTVSALVAFALIYKLLSISFIRVVTTVKGAKKIKYKEKELQTADIKGALLGRELLRFRMNSTVLVNFGLGLIMFVGIGIAAVVLKGRVQELLATMGTSMGEMLILAGTAGIIYIGTMSPITAPSISLEANTLWILKSLPIPAKEVLMSKLKSHLVLTIPASLVAIGGVVFALEPSVLAGVLAVVCVIAFNLFIATWGLRLNIKKPSFNWQNEAAAVKRSASVTITMLGSMGTVLTFALIYAFLGDHLTPELILGIAAAFYAIIAAFNFRWLCTKGVEEFESF